MSEILINSQNFKNNLDIISSRIGKDKLALVLKNNAYGHGIEQIAPLASDYGIKSIFVKNFQEAQKISHLFSHITVLYGEVPCESPRNICVSINSLTAIKSLSPNRLVELKVNTGMNRNGIARKDLAFFIEKILTQKLALLGVFSHNGYADEEGNDFEEAQKNWAEIKEEIIYLSDKLSFSLPRFHSLNSAGAFRSENISDDLVRIGIGAYGYLPLAFPEGKNLKPVASLWAEKICEQILPKGSRIGYGGKSVLEEDAIISTYDVGYGDGFFRLNERNAKLTTAEGYEIFPITSMDCFSCLSTQERVCVFNDATIIARLFDTIAYEVLTNLSPFIERKVV